MTLGLWAWIFQSVIWAWLSSYSILVFWKSQWYNASKMISTVMTEHLKMQYLVVIHYNYAPLILLLWIKWGLLLHSEWHKIIQYFNTFNLWYECIIPKEVSTHKLSQKIRIFSHLYYDILYDLSLTSVGLVGPIQNSMTEFTLWHSES